MVDRILRDMSTEFVIDDTEAVVACLTRGLARYAKGPNKPDFIVDHFLPRRWGHRFLYSDL